VTTPILFYFDFTSPHTYLALDNICRVAEHHGRAIDWRAMSVFQLWDAIDYHPIGKPRAKARYIRRDFERAAAVAGLPFQMPKPFPVDAVLARQLFYSVKADAPDLAADLAAALFTRYWAEGEDITTAEQIAAAAAPLGIAVDAIRAAGDDPAAADAVAAASAQAVEDGAFGAPYFVVDGEPFWGHDRVAHIDWRLSQAGADSSGG